MSIRLESVLFREKVERPSRRNECGANLLDRRPVFDPVFLDSNLATKLWRGLWLGQTTAFSRAQTGKSGTKDQPSFVLL